MGRSGLVVSVGEVFGNLSIVCELPTRPRKSGGTERWFRCLCLCGQEVDVPLQRLRAGKTRSCGCFQRTGKACSDEMRESLREMAASREGFHGMADSTEYSIWKGIKARCYKASAKGYSRYGGRGIVVCGGWRSSFKTFFDDIGSRPSLLHSVDRIDGDAHYSCGHCEECLKNGWTANCRWATPAEQRRNASNIRMITFRGETMCMTDWAKRYGMSKGTLQNRLESGMSVEEALTTPVRQFRSDRQFYAVPESERDSEWNRDAARRQSRSNC